MLRTQEVFAVFTVFTVFTGEALLVASWRGGNSHCEHNCFIEEHARISPPSMGELKHITEQTLADIV
jgi:hypothetical protein